MLIYRSIGNSLSGIFNSVVKLHPLNCGVRWSRPLSSIFPLDLAVNEALLMSPGHLLYMMFTYQFISYFSNT